MLHPSGLLLPHSPDLLLELPDDELVAQVWAARLEHLAAVRGIAPTDITMEMALNLVQPTLGMNTDNVAMAGLEKVLKAIASGNIAGAARMFRDLLRQGARNRKLLDEYAANRRRQRERAKKPREDELNGVIRKIVKRRRNISEPELRAELDRIAHNGHEVIRELDGHYIHVIPREQGPIKKIKLSALRGRLSRIKNPRI